MTDTTVSLRIDTDMHSRMHIHEEINWSAVIRKKIKEKLDALETIDKDKARHAIQEMNKLRLRGAFSAGLNSTQIIRTWRQKRK